jgi:hypothetical protein
MAAPVPNGGTWDTGDGPMDGAEHMAANAGGKKEGADSAPDARQAAKKGAPPEGSP